MVAGFNPDSRNLDKPKSQQAKIYRQVKICKYVGGDPRSFDRYF